MSSAQGTSNAPVNYTFTVGKLERASLIEFPALLLPQGVTLGSVVDIRVTRNDGEEQKHREEFVALQDDILQMYGINSPAPPALRLRHVTQTTVTLEWDPLQLANADLLSFDIVRNGQRIAKIPRPLSTTSTKLSGLSMDTDYTIQLVLYTSAGVFPSDELRTRTHTINDMSGIHACLGGINDPRLREATKRVIEALGAKCSDQIQLDTTHLITTHEPPRDGPDAQELKVYEKALQLSIPIVQPHWLFACQDEQRMVNISGYYLDTIPSNAMRVKERLGSKPRQGIDDEAPAPPAKDEIQVVDAVQTEEEVAEPVERADEPAHAAATEPAEDAQEDAPEATDVPDATDASNAPNAPDAPAGTPAPADTRASTGAPTTADDTLESEMENIAL